MAAGTWPDVALAASGATRTDEKTANTFDRSVDSKLWAALQAKSPILDMLQRPSVDNFKFEWETDVAPARTIQAHGDASATTIDNSNSNTAIELISIPAWLEKGALIRNISRATPLGSFGQSEVMEITAINTSTNVIAVHRNAGRFGDAATGSTLQCYDGTTTQDDTYEVLYVPKQEGSGPDANKYTDVGLEYNFCNSVDFFLTITGDQAATRRLVGGDTVENQFSKNLLKLQNDLEQMFFYGVLQYGDTAHTQTTNPTTHEAGSSAYIRRTKGFDSFISTSSGNFDVTTKDVTPDALDGLFYQILEDKTDPSDRFIIACHPYNARKVSQFGIDKVVTDNNVTKWGRHIDTFKSDLGVEAPVIWSLNISKSDLFIIDMNKVFLPVFRPFERAQWSYGDDGVDAFRQRYLGSFGVKVVDSMYSHAKLGLLPWS